MDLAPDFSEFCELLSAHDVEFVVVGAHALAFHGAPRFTGDLDILVRPTLDNGQRLLSAIAAFGFPTTTLTPDDIVAGNKVIEMGVVPVQTPCGISIRKARLFEGPEASGIKSGEGHHGCTLRSLSFQLPRIACYSTG